MAAILPPSLTRFLVKFLIYTSAEMHRPVKSELFDQKLPRQKPADHYTIELAHLEMGKQFPQNGTILDDSEPENGFPFLFEQFTS